MERKKSIGFWDHNNKWRWWMQEPAGELMDQVGCIDQRRPGAVLHSTNELGEFSQ